MNLKIYFLDCGSTEVINMNKNVPELSNFKDLKSFRFWCQKVLPLVYDDSLSYYELLCKVVNYLNNTIENVNNLRDYLEDLYNYIINLDFQEFVDNWFNEAETSGKLDDLFMKHTLPVINVENYGVIGDGITDNSVAMQDIIDKAPCGALIYFPPCKTYRMHFVNLKSNLTLFSVNKGAIIMSYEHTDVGKYNDTIFNIENSSNVFFKNLTFSGETTSGGYVETELEDKIMPLVFFNGCSNIILDKCCVTNTISNVNPISSEQHYAYRWCSFSLYTCNNIFIRMEQHECFTDGFTCFRCNNVDIALISDNNRLSTSFNAEYCYNVSLHDSVIVENESGSTINFLVNGGIIENCSFSGGTGLDFGNEMCQVFNTENIIIKNCIIDTRINTVTTNESIIKNIQIESCKFIDDPNNISTQKIRLLNAEDVKVINNLCDCNAYFVTMSGTCDNLIIANNAISALCVLSGDCKYTNTIIQNNIFNDRVVGTGASSDFRAITLQNDSSITLIGNTFNCSTGAVGTNNVNEAHIIAIGNIFKCSSPQTQRVFEFLSTGTVYIYNCVFETTDVVTLAGDVSGVIDGCFFNNTGDKITASIRCDCYDMFITNCRSTLDNIVTCATGQNYSVILGKNIPNKVLYAKNNVYGDSSQRIETGNIGDIFTETSGNMYAWNGSEWKQISTI